MKNEKPHEECGVFGVRMEADEAAGVTYNALLALQHRGQEGAGIAVLRENSILYHKDVGLVSEVFSAAELEKMPRAHAAVGHVRYSTTGANSRDNVQPMVVEYLRGRLAAVHNGNIVNAPAIRKKLQDAGCNFAAQSDSEVIAALIAFEALKWGDIEQAVELAARQLVGSFSLVVLGSGGKLIALRDGHGFRPLCIGRSGADVAFASESCALECAGFAFERDLAPGELVTVTADGEVRSRQALTPEKEGMCAFEYVYFARTDSVLEGVSVYDARIRMGEVLYREHPIEADIVCGVPDSGTEAAMGYARAGGLPFAPGFVKNRYIGRSFIFPSQQQRDAAVRLKLNPLGRNVRGKRVVMVDDSIVRGTTSRRTVALLRGAGAKEVHLLVSSPPFRYECHFGTDIDSAENLIANRMSVEETAAFIGADSVGYLSIEGLREACGGCGLGLCMGCFDGNYPVSPGHHTKFELETGHPDREEDFS